MTQPANETYQEQQGLDEQLQIVRRYHQYFGQNSLDQPDAISEEEWATLQNADTHIKGIASTRAGSTAVGTSSGSLPIVGLGHYYPEGGTKVLTRVQGTKWQYWDGTTGWTDLISSLTSGLQAGLLVAGNLQFLLNGTDNVRSLDKTLAVTDEGNTNASFPRTRFGIYHQNKAIVAGNLTNGSYMWYSDTLVPRNWLRDLHVLKVADQDNDFLTALVNMSITTSQGFIALKQRSIHFVASSAADPLNWSIIPIDPVHGCYATRTAVAIGGSLTGGGDVFYLSKEANQYRLRSMTRSIADAILDTGVLSYAIEDVLANVNHAQMQNAAAIYFNQKYILAIPSGSSSYNDTVCVLDLKASRPNEGVWKWSIFKGWNAAAFSIFQESSVEYIYFGDSSASTQVYRGFSGTSDNGAAIQFIAEGRREDFGVPELSKIFEHVEVSFQSTDDTVVTVDAQIDGGGYTTIGTLNVKDSSPALPVNLPFNLTAPTIIRKKLPMSELGPGRNVQIRATHSDLNKTVKYLGYSIAAFYNPLELGV